MNTSDVPGFLAAWADAENRGDAESIAALITDDFQAVGPRGFVLDKTQWLERYRSGKLRNDHFEIEEPTTRDLGDTAVTIAVQDQSGTYDGNDTTGRFTATLITTWRDGQRMLTGVHLSPRMEGM